MLVGLSSASVSWPLELNFGTSGSTPRYYTYNILILCIQNISEAEFGFCQLASRVAVRCSVLQCVAVRCSVLQCVAVCCSAPLELDFGTSGSLPTYYTHEI